MAGKIKGITIEIGGDTQPLEKALGDVNQKTRDLQGELKSVDRLLKLDPGNVELLTQKQKLLAEQVDNSREKLNRLKVAQEQVNAAFAKGDLSEEQYRHFSRQVINAEQDLKKFEGQLKDVSSTAKKAGVDVKEMGDKLKGVGQGMSIGVTAPIVGGFAALTEGTRELRMDLGKLEAAFTTAGFTAEQAKDVYFDFYGILGESDTAIEAVNHLSQMAKSQEELSAWTTIATGVYATFGDSLPIGGRTEAANETAKVGEVTGPLADALNWAGINEDAFNESLASCSSEQERQALIIETLSGLYGDAAAKYREVNAEVIAANEANARLKDSFAILGATLEPILTPIIEKITELVNKFNELSPTMQNVALVIAGLAAAIGPLLIALGMMASGLGAIVGILPVLGVAFAALTGPVGLVIAAVAAVIAIGVALYKNWDEIKAFGSRLWEDLKTGWTEGMESIKVAWADFGQNIKDTWSNMWGSVMDKYNSIKADIIGLTTNMITWVEGKFTSFKGFFLDIWAAITGGVKGYINNVIGFVNKLIDALNSIKVEIPDWVPGFGGQKFGIDLPHVPALATGTNYIPRDMLAYLHKGEAVVPAKYNPANTTTTVIKEIHIHGNNPDEIWSKFERNLHKLGVVF